MNLSRISRLLQLLRLLQAGRGHNSSSLAQACGVSRRTIFRDLDTLREVGVPLQFDTELERYYVPDTYFLPPTNFTAEEALAVIVLCHEVAGSGQVPFFEPAHSAALKLEGSFPRQLQKQLRSLTQSLRVKPTPVSPLNDSLSKYRRFVDAIAERRSVRISYDSLTEWKVISTKLRPYQLLFNRRSWYVIGRSSLHRQNRTFHLGRVTKMEELDDTFRIPRGFSVERYLKNAWSLVPEPGPDYNVAVRFQPLVARNVAEVAWHKTQEVEWNDDGTLDFKVTVTGIGEISWWILGYGANAEVLKPPQLRERVAQHAKRMLSVYESNGKPSESSKT